LNRRQSDIEYGKTGAAMSTNQTKLIIGVVVVLIVLILGVMVIYLMNNAPASTAVEAVHTPTVHITSTYSDLRIKELPATWTPLPEATRATLEMATQQHTATAAVQRAIATVRPPVQLSGTGSQDTELFTMDKGHWKFNWEYSGKPGEPGNVSYAKSRHFATMNTLINTHNEDLKRLQEEEQAAKDSGDAAAVKTAQEKIETLKTEYYQKVQREEERHKEEMAGYLTTFAIQVGRADNPEKKTFVSMTGVYSGWAIYSCRTAADDYQLTVTASGPWKIWIEPEDYP
jgi:hypothetical protein